MLSTQIKSCLFLLETDSFCSLTVALHTRICQPTVKIRITSLSLLSQSFTGFDFETVWTMDGNPAYPYPELINNPHFYADTPGDVNGDGFITAADANIAMRMALSLVEFDLAGDANGDGIVNAADANIVMRWALGL